ncbi:hypothetical protein HY485_03195 [Candidatus Woesearchaeota archaeon]|nr:hypothetical protein [Candidatus Woesearchaeota archaeon]
MNNKYLKIATVALQLLFGGCEKQDSTSQKLSLPTNRTNVLANLQNVLDDYNDTTFVVGALAPASDVIGIVDITTRLEADLAQRNPGSVFHLGTVQFDVDAMNNIYGNHTVAVGTPEDNMIIDLVKTNLDMPHETALPPTGTGVIVGYLLPTNKVAVVATGRTSQDARNAAKALSEYNNIVNGKKVDVDGTEIHVHGTSKTDLWTEVMRR